MRNGIIGFVAGALVVGGCWYFSYRGPVVASTPPQVTIGVSGGLVGAVAGSVGCLHPIQGEADAAAEWPQMILPPGWNADIGGGGDWEPIP